MATTVRADTLLGPHEIGVLLHAAIRAPSLHNSQPWTFAVRGGHIEVYADASRQLPRADPTGRSLLIGCGAAVFNLRVAAWTATSRRSIGGGPTGARSATPRCPSRPGRPSSRPPAPRVPCCACTTTPAEVARIVDLLHDADRADDGRYADTALARTTERQAWVGLRHRDDGIPARSLGPLPDQPRAAFRDLGQAVGVARDEATFEATPTVAVLSTMHDQPGDWLRAGQALERLLLAATNAGLAASFLNQPLEHEALRSLVRSPTSGVGNSHMILRLGYSDEVPDTPRRPLSDVRRQP